VLTTLALLLGLLGSLSQSQAQAHTASRPPIPVSDCKSDVRLRMAIDSARPGDTIQFGCSGIIPIGRTLDISKSLTLDGTGQTVTLNGQDRVRVIEVDIGTFTLKHLTIFGGLATLSTAGFKFGGGLLDEGAQEVTIINSTFINNTALFGGGIANVASRMTITNSGFTTNMADHMGGAIENFRGTMTITHSSIFNNTTKNSGGGISNREGKVTIRDSSLSNNYPTNCSGPITTEGHNDDSDGSCHA
jgi:hypothetical protein